MRFGCVVVNYGTPELALDAALSALGDGAAAALIVDNASPDDSLARLEVARRCGRRPESPTEPLRGVVPDFAPADDPRLSVIAAPDNAGFAAGYNIGLNRLLQRSDIDAFLLLNPDAVVARGALTAFSERLADRSVGLCGATVVSFAAPHRVQAYGGASMDPVLHRGFNLGAGAELADAPDRDSVESRLAYPLGAAMACRRDFVTRAGLLDERYFLYYEEPDWVRAGAPLRPGWARSAVVYHRYGAASGSAQSRPDAASRRSPLSDRHMIRSRILYARKWAPATAPLARAAALWQSARRIAQGRRANAAAVFSAALETPLRR